MRVGAEKNDVAKGRQSFGDDWSRPRRRQLRRERQQDVHVVGRAEPRGSNEHAYTGMCQCVLQLSPAVGWIDVHEHGASLCRGVLRDHPLGAVAAPDADPVASLHPERDQRAGGTIGLVAKLAVRVAQLLMTRHDRVAVAPAFGRTVQGAADRVGDQRRRPDAVDVREVHLDTLMAMDTFREARSSIVLRNASTKSWTTLGCAWLSR